MSVKPHEINRFKYPMRAMLVDMFGTEKAINKAKEDISKKYKINAFTLDKDFGTRMGETFEIPLTRLLCYADYFKCTVDYLLRDYLKFKEAVGI